MKFEKWQALGNDYLILEAAALPFALTPGRIQAICAPHTGVFADGVLLLSDPQATGTVAQLRIFNPDGSEAELSGNGAREAILYMRQRGWTEDDEFSIETAAGVIRARIDSSQTCSVDMGTAQLASPDYPSGTADGVGELDAAGRSWRFRHVNVGNPQCAIPVASEEELEELDLPAIGPGIEHHALFPNRTNVSWFCTLVPGRIRTRIFERGVGETSASGTGATGAAVAYVLEQPDAPRQVTVVLDGGELEVNVGRELEIALTGWARAVFSGELSDDLVEELNATQ